MLGLGFGGIAVVAAVVALAVGMSQAVGTRACAAVLSASDGTLAGQAQQAGEVSGIATHYVLQGLPNCSYPSPPADGLFVALSPGEYDSAAACGGYLEVHGPDGSVRVEVIDQCPGCGDGHIDLSETAFSALAPLNQGLINVTYQPLVNPSLPGPVSLVVKQGSSPYWLALLAMNTGNPLTSVQVQSASGGGWYNLVQASYNYWVAQSGAGAGPFTVRLTDTQGHVVTVQDVALSPGVVQGTGTWMYGAGATTEPASTPAPAPRTSRPVASATSAQALSSRAADELNAGPGPSRLTSPPSASPTC
ncbi:MAG TPA: expansin EXLX1 family cellulose-binding protein [Trebonia sp.]|nr:expansin EXLX1 family cellulose-binding protein [Trebonia sp.]